jgi:hypothetical protein
VLSMDSEVQFVQRLLENLMAHGTTGTASVAELRALEFLADADANRRVFGQPLSATVGYYLAEYLCLAQASERFAEKRKSSP